MQFEISPLSLYLAVDYDPLEVYLSFGPVAEAPSTQCVNISVTDDNITESVETFSLALEPASDFVTVTRNTSSVDVYDDDGEFLSLVSR